jgi:hypothetical protein
VNVACHAQATADDPGEREVEDTEDSAMLRRRLVQIGLVTALLMLGLAVTVAALPSANTGDRIHPGMTYKEVESVAGTPTPCIVVDGLGYYSRAWICPDGRLVVDFANGLTQSHNFTPSDFNLLARLRSRLPW